MVDGGNFRPRISRVTGLRKLRSAVNEGFGDEDAFGEIDNQPPDFRLKLSELAFALVLREGGRRENGAKHRRRKNADDKGKQQGRAGNFHNNFRGFAGKAEF